MKKAYTQEKVQSIREDIMKAAEKLYKKYGYEYVNLLRISAYTHLSRPSIYNYYHSKEEIFLDILLREYSAMGEDLKKALTKEQRSCDELAEQLGEVILKHLYLLKLVSSYENSIETNSTIAHLADYRKGWEETFYQKFMEGLSYQFEDISEVEKDNFINLFVASLYGIYPLICPSEERVSALKAAGHYREIDRHQFVTKTMKLLLTNLCNAA